MPQLHAIVHGHVQGVSFRYYAQREAQLLGLKGWVRNLWDGTVETLAVGDRNALDEYLQWLHHGPSSARVYEVQFEWGEPTQSYLGFEIQHVSD